MVINNSTF